MGAATENLFFFFFFSSATILTVSSLLGFTCLLSPPPVDAHTTITHLPGYNGPLPFHLETGYVVVDEEEGANMFYYFIQSQREPKEDPVMLWLTGGPGCSALSALLFEIGPMTIDFQNYDGGLPTLIHKEYSWTKVFNVIFLDSPIGTGFSSKVHGSGDFDTVTKIYTFLKKWFARHQNFQSNSFYVGGDSYSGIPLPILVKEIADCNDAGEENLINLKGYFVGNPVTDDQFEGDAKIPYAHGVGFISDELYESAKESCGGKYATPRDAKCAAYVNAALELTERINPPYILEPLCDSVEPEIQVISNRKADEYASNLLSLKTILSDCREYRYLLAFFWANNDMVKEALGVDKEITDTWKRCNRSILYTRDVASSIPYHQYLTSKGYRALVYSGDHDFVVPFLGTQAWIRSLNFSIVKEWKPWWVDGQIAGYTRTYSNNLTFATVKGAGHTAPEYRPKECLEMIRRWLYAESL